ncbi:lipase [Saccharopolyspora erythraea]|nr:lipase [Saccharopolyspora erythraea]QRK90756.1 lipase [Saccharopolyspora erythraea]
MRIRNAVVAVAAAVTVIGGVSPAAGAQPPVAADETAVGGSVGGIAEAGAAGGTADAAAAGGTAEAGAAEEAPAGANDWSCEPSDEHPVPVVLVHGLGGAAATNWAYIAPLLADEGYCVFALTYGRPPGMPPVTGGFAPMEQSAEELADFVDLVLEVTGASRWISWGIPRGR